MKISDYKKQLEEAQKTSSSYECKGDEKDMKEFFLERKVELIEARAQKGIEKIWHAADNAYTPKSGDDAGNKKAVFVSDDELGWRSSKQILGADENWQETAVPPNLYVKIQTAMAVLVDRNPTAEFKPNSKKYTGNTLLLEDLNKKSWDTAKSKRHLLKPFVLNLSKYGFAVGRTYPKLVKRSYSELEKYDLKTDTRTYKKDIEHIVYNDVFRESINPWHCWFDPSEVLTDPFSRSDNMWFMEYSYMTFRRLFGHLANAKFVSPYTGDLIDYSRPTTMEGSKQSVKNVVRVWFYENLDLDMLFVMTDGGIPLVYEPLPQRAKNKRLSLNHAHWTMRNDKDIEGIGLYEAMRGDHKLHLKLRNMTVDQVALSIYKEFFYEGTGTNENDGVMFVTPGKGRQVLNPQNIKWNEVPGPGKDAWDAIAMQKEAMEEATGVTRGLSGEVVGETAYETAQARESALKRMKTPLENITDFLEQDAYATLSIMEDLYSLPKIHLIGEDRFIDEAELLSLQQQSEESGEEMPATEEKYKEVPLNLELSEDGSVERSDKEEFIELRPPLLDWEGVITVKGTSILADSELLERMGTTEMANIVIPLLSAPPEIAMKPATEIIKSYKKDPKDWLPDAWFAPAAPPNLFAPAAPAAPGGEEVPPTEEVPPVETAETVVPPSSVAGLTTPQESLSATM